MLEQQPQSIRLIFKPCPAVANQDVLLSATAAKHLGLDGVRFNHDLATPQVHDRILQNLQNVQVHAATGTPALLLDGVLLVDLSREALNRRIAEA